MSAEAVWDVRGAAGIAYMCGSRCAKQPEAVKSWRLTRDSLEGYCNLGSISSFEDSCVCKLQADGGAAREEADQWADAGDDGSHGACIGEGAGQLCLQSHLNRP